MGVVGGTRVEALDQALRDAVVEGDARRAARGPSCLDRGFEGVDDLRRRAAGVFGLVLEAVVGAGVVGGGDDDGAAGVLVEDGVAGDRRGGGGVEDVGLDAVGGDDLGAGGGEVLGAEARVEADDEAAFGEAGRLQVARDALGAVADVLERVVLGDDGAPAVGAELDGCTSVMPGSSVSLAVRGSLASDFVGFQSSAPGELDAALDACAVGENGAFDHGIVADPARRCR